LRNGHCASIVDSISTGIKTRTCSKRSARNRAESRGPRPVRPSLVRRGTHLSPAPTRAQLTRPAEDNLPGPNPLFRSGWGRALNRKLHRIGCNTGHTVSALTPEEGKELAPRSKGRAKDRKRQSSRGRGRYRDS
jgi:hypothetical protein